MFRPRHHRHRHWVIQWSLSLLVLVQFLGLLHGVAHRPNAQVPSVALAARADASFGHAIDSAECRIFDHLAHGDLAPGKVPALACDAMPSPRIAHVPHGQAHRFERTYSARAPPGAA